jgi:hypothetical protein
MPESDRIEARLKEGRRFLPSDEFVAHARVPSHPKYAAMYKQSIEEPEVLWREQTVDLSWRTPWSQFSDGSSRRALHHLRTALLRRDVPGLRRCAELSRLGTPTSRARW